MEPRLSHRVKTDEYESSKVQFSTVVNSETFLVESLGRAWAQSMGPIVTLPFPFQTCQVTCTS